MSSKREKVARAICNTSRMHQMYHMPGDEPRKWRTPGGAIWDTTPLSEQSASRIYDIADAAIAALGPDSVTEVIKDEA